MQAAQERVLIEFGAKVRSARAERGYSQEAFAEVVGIHRTYIGDVERGTRNISLINIARIAQALEIPLSELFGGASAGKR